MDDQVGVAGNAQASGMSTPLQQAAVATLTRKEERFEYWRRTAGLFAGPAALLLLWALPMPGLSLEAHRLAGIMALVVIWWVLEAIPVAATALAGAALTVVAGVASAEEAFAPFASPVIFLFLGSFIIGRAISTHQLDRHIALSLLSSGAVAGRLSRIPLAIGLPTILLSAWISNTATAAMMTPLALGVLSAVRTDDALFARAYSTRVLLTIAFAASIGGMLTPVGAPHNLVALGFLDRTTGIRIDFFTWMLLAAPIALTMAGALVATSVWQFRKMDRSASAGRSWVQQEALKTGGWTPGQRNCLIAFLTAATLWITPGVLAVAGLLEGDAGNLIRGRLNEGTVAILAASLLFVLPTNWKERTFTISWKEAGRIDWGTVLLFGGGLSLGRLMFKTGLAERLGTAVIAMSGAESIWAITTIAAIVTILVTQVSSNVSSTAMLTPIIISISVAAGVNPIPPTMAVALVAGIAFMLPIATPPNAIVYGTGLVPIVAMMKFGFLLNVIGLVVVLLGLRLMCPLLGLA